MTMECAVPRIMIAGTGSGCGKTTVTCAVLQALRNRGSDIEAFKCGPDYIDPMFHRFILQSGCTNLDSFFFSPNTLNYLLARHGEGKDLSVIEGVMGFYDGLGISTCKASSYEIAAMTDTPVVLVINAKGTALSALAVLEGFANFMPGDPVRGVILNRCSEMTYRTLSAEILDHFEGKIIPVGYLPALPDCTLESRHLGLITAGEVKDLREKIDLLAAQAGESIDLNKLICLANEAKPVRCDPVILPDFSDSLRIAVARDKAFCFYYQDNTKLLEEMGAEIVPFSPLADSGLPGNIQGLYLGGGYPELYADRLSGNTGMIESIRTCLAQGLPCIAECGGFMYLTEAIDGHPMVGYLPGTCHNNGKLTRFGYIRLKAGQDSMLFSEGREIPAHEFHHWDCTDPGAALTASKTSGKSWNCAAVSDRLYAGFPHFHFYADPDLAVRFYKTCLQYKEEHR